MIGPKLNPYPQAASGCRLDRPSWKQPPLSNYRPTGSTIVSDYQQKIIPSTDFDSSFGAAHADAAMNLRAVAGLYRDLYLSRPPPDPDLIALVATRDGEGELIARNVNALDCANNRLS